MTSARSDLHEDFRRSDEQSAEVSSDRNFGLVLAGAFTVFALLAWHSGRSTTIWLFIVAVVLAAVALAVPRALAIPKRLWLMLGRALHAVVSPIILAIMFFGVITPMAGLMRLAGHDPMRRRRDSSAASYWIPRLPPGPPPDTMRNQF
jgi:Flp pilus assembly protein TadB